MEPVKVPKDLTRVKSKVLFNLTKRQLICFTLGATVGVPVYLLTRGSLGNTVASTILIILALPFFMFAMYEKDGMPLEKLITVVIRAKLIRPPVRTYMSRNLYRKVQDSSKEEISDFKINKK